VGDRVRETLDRLQGLMVEVETAQRGYALTGQDAFLVPYREALGSVSSELDVLRREVEEAPDGSAHRRRQVQRLEALVGRKLSISREVIFVRRFNGAQEAGDLVGRGEEKRVMDEIRTVVHDIRQEEAGELARSAASQRAGMERAPLIALAALLIAAGVAVLSLLALQRDARRRASAEAEERVSTAGEPRAAHAAHLGDRTVNRP
jgi:CHASE3 domain sensor protein